VRPAHTCALAFLLGASLLFAACGGGGEGQSPTAATPPAGIAASPRPGSKAAAPGVPTTKGGDNSIQTWGLEASSTERASATAVVQAFLDARTRADWANACSYLAAKQRTMFERLARGKSGNAACAEGMGLLAAHVPASAFAHEAEILEVLSLRVGGGNAFLIYSRPGGKVYATALGSEDGAWKVISVGPTALG
jgi:hypothetical protein